MGHRCYDSSCHTPARTYFKVIQTGRYKWAENPRHGSTSLSSSFIIISGLLCHRESRCGIVVVSQLLSRMEKSEALRKGERRMAGSYKYRPSGTPSFFLYKTWRNRKRKAEIGTSDVSPFPWRWRNRPSSPSSASRAKPKDQPPYTQP